MSKIEKLLCDGPLSPTLIFQHLPMILILIANVKIISKIFLKMVSQYLQHGCASIVAVDASVSNGVKRKLLHSTAIAIKNIHFSVSMSRWACELVTWKHNFEIWLIWKHEFWPRINLKHHFSLGTSLLALKQANQVGSIIIIRLFPSWWRCF